MKQSILQNPEFHNVGRNFLHILTDTVHLGVPSHPPEHARVPVDRDN